LHVLLEERAERTPGTIPALDLRGLIDFAAAADDAEIVLIVLVADEFLVEGGCRLIRVNGQTRGQ